MNGSTKPTIVVVEDENVVAMDLVSSLERLHYRVAGVASSGEEAVALAERSRPGLVLMDIHLRGALDGIQAGQQIHERLAIPVVYLTAYSDQATLDRARVTHPFGYVLKPFEERELEVAIQMAVFRHDMERALRASENRLDAILASIGDAVVATDIDGRVTFINRAAEVLLQRKSERARGRRLEDVLKLARDDERTVRLVRADTGDVRVEVVESPVLDAAGEPAGHVTVIRDISERLRALEAHDREIVEREARAAAEREHDRARLKGEISLILADITQSPDMKPCIKRVAELVAQAFSGFAIVDIDDGDRELRLMAHAQPEWLPAMNDVLDERQRGSSRGLHAVARTGTPELESTLSSAALADIVGGGAELDVLRGLELASYLCVPLRARTRNIGALALFSTCAHRRYDQSDVAFAQQIADRIGLALDNARLYREAQEARIAAERLALKEKEARTEAEALLRIADVLNEAQLDVDGILQRVTDEATALVGARFGAFFYNVGDGAAGSYMLYTLSGAPKEAFEKFGLPRNTPIFGPTFAGESVVRLDDVRKDPRYGRMPPHYGMPPGHLPVVSYLAVPVVSRTGAVIGGLFFGHSEPAQFTEQHERMARALAAHAAVVIDNARLFAETREAEERQSRLVRDLERSLRFSDLFVGILGHDLRNPLSAIVTAASLVMARETSERVTKPLRRILSSSERMSRMIDQILDFTRVRLGGGIPLQRDHVEVADVCNLVLDELKGGSETGPDIRLEIRGETRGIWDRDRLAQLLSNLVGNALQHRVPATPVFITLDGSRPERLILEVQNDGVIDAAVLPSIFEPLRGGDLPKRRGSSGLGLGLYISQQIVAAHQGEIHVVSNSQTGTRFRVELPRNVPDEEKAS